MAGTTAQMNIGTTCVSEDVGRCCITSDRCVWRSLNMRMTCAVFKKEGIIHGIYTCTSYMKKEQQAMCV
jgi:uncharacterized protein (UPF0254 family)